ncbi:MAG TPA: ABC transporter substrate-binding protein [Actinomycetota bacterium]|nr:ABC transporter substrate-binding protein [Actinomycetota bacterium]
MDGRKPVSVFAVVAILALIAGACSSKSNTGGGGGTAATRIVWGTTDSETSNDPAKCYEIFCGNLIQEVYSRLVSYPASGTTIEPDLAASLPQISSDGLTYTFTLKDGLKFSDGSAIDANAVVFSINRAIKLNVSGSAAFLLSDVMKTVTAPDAKTVVFTLKRPNSTFLARLSFSVASVVNPKVMPANAVAPNTLVAGSGYYMMPAANYVEGQSIQLDANPNSVLGQPKTKTVLIKFYSSSSALKLALQNKEVDLGFRTFAANEVSSLKSDTSITTTGPGLGRVRFLVFNMKDPQFKNNLHLRQAIAYAIDRDRINTDAFNGTVKPLYSMLRSSFGAYDPVFQTEYGSKPDKTKVDSELAAAGVPAGQKVSLTLWAVNGTTHYGAAEQDVQQSIVRQLQETGRFTVKTQTEDWTAYKADLAAGKFGFFQLGWFPDYFDPDDYFDPFIGSGSDSQGSFFHDPTASALIAQEQKLTDETARDAVFKQLQKFIADRVLYIPLWEESEYVFTQKSVSGTALDVTSFLRIEVLSKSS